MHIVIFASPLLWSTLPLSSLARLKVSLLSIVQRSNLIVFDTVVICSCSIIKIHINRNMELKKWSVFQFFFERWESWWCCIGKLWLFFLEEYSELKQIYLVSIQFRLWFYALSFRFGVVNIKVFCFFGEFDF